MINFTYSYYNLGYKEKRLRRFKANNSKPQLFTLIHLVLNKILIVNIITNKTKKKKNFRNYNKS